jgi:hypothetical protein
MNYSRVALAAVGGTFACFAVGGLLFVVMPSLVAEVRKYPAVYRRPEEMKSVMPVGLLGTFVAILIAAMNFAMIYAGGAGLAESARFGGLLGIFVVCVFVLHNYVNLNIGSKLALQQTAAYFLQWAIVGIVIGMIYKPLVAR